MEKNKNRLLFITQKIHENDDDLAFAPLWVKAFIAEGFDVSVICLERGDFSGGFPVHSLGKERGRNKIQQAIEFLRLALSLKYDRVFVHMNPEYFTLGGWWWALNRIPSYFWYTHYTMSVHVFIAGIIARRLFAATAQSLPQYDGSSKKIVLGHGIDLGFWHGSPASERLDTEIVYINRLSRSKRIDLSIRTLAFLPPAYRLSVYGRVVPGEESYFEELKKMASAIPYAGRVTFMGSLPMSELKNIYPRYRIMLNLAKETIDKTMLEGMIYGLFPVTTPGNSKAIGLPVYPADETPEALAEFILKGRWKLTSSEQLKQIVAEKHSLSALIKKMGTYIRAGT